ncbi:TIM barrel protein [Candidatus Micrarchaeota archaeon]|nr:TIM barrel protein [Candidatus Micrarchaeota archaeon]
MGKIRFGPAGIPIQCHGSSLDGIQCAYGLGLSALEVQYGHGINMGLDLAKQCGKLAKKLDVKLSAHGQYAISLISEKKETAEASANRVLEAARRVNAMDGERVVFHSGYYGKLGKEESYPLMKKAFEKILAQAEKEKLKVIIGPETTGAYTEWGSLEELCKLSQEFGINRVMPTLDWAHLHCREGKPVIKGKDDYKRIFDYLEKHLGKKAVENFHSHATGVFFTEKGEKHHLPISSNSPPLRPLIELLAENGYSGTIISESPNIEADALLMKKWFEAASK